MLKQRLVRVFAAAAIIAAIMGASAGVANTLVASHAPNGQAIACNTSGGSGGGC